VPDFLTKDQLVKGGVYAIRSRNLIVGVYNGDEGFIGVREKMGARYLFTEYLAREQGGTKVPVDTVHPEKLVVMLPEGIDLRERFDGALCLACGKPARWTGRRDPATNKVIPGPWECESGCEDVIPRSKENRALFDYLDKVESELDPDGP